MTAGSGGPEATLATLVRSNGIELAYDSVGDPADPPIVLIAGLGAQLVGWSRELCLGLTGRGFRVVRFDNRDAGLSTKFPDGGYWLSDMADDVAGLIDALALGSAHVVGQSLGGMIAQALVTRRPERVRSLCLLSTTPNLSHFLPAGVDVIAGDDSPARDRAEAVERYLAMESFFASSDHPPDVEAVRELAGAMWDRCWYPEGTAHQLAAIIGSPDLAPALGAVAVPTVVIHGEADPLIAPTGGRALAEAIPGAELRILPTMGHQLPAALWPEVMDLIVANASRRSGAGLFLPL